jgi:hypothetical protein
MTLAPIKLPDAAKLDVLRRLDQFREWQSLDEKRYCLVCGNVIAGRDVEVRGDDSETNPMQVACPTVHCNSIPMDWVRPTREILAAWSTRQDDRLPQATH